MSVDPNDPTLSPDPPAPVADPVESLRDEIKKLNEEQGRLRQQNVELQRRVDARELAPPVPTDPVRTTDQPDELETFILQGLDEGERAAPWTDTVVKTVKRLMPRIDNRIDERAGLRVRVQAADDEFYAFAVEAQGKDPTVKNIREFERRYGKEVNEITQELVQRGGRFSQVTDAFQPVYDELQRRHGQAVDDFKPARAPEPRAATGDRGGSGRPPAPRTNRAPTKAEEVAGFVRDVAGA